MLHCAYLLTFTAGTNSMVLAPPIVDEGRYQCAPASLMRCSDARAIVAVVELVEQYQVVPMRVLLEFGRAAVHRPHSSFVARIDPDHAIGNLTGNFEEVLLAAGVAWNADFKVITVARTQGAER